MFSGWFNAWKYSDVGAISAPARTVRDESGAAAGSRCSVGRGPRTADRRPPTMSTQQILFQDQVRPRPRRERASGARPAHALGFEATLLTQPAASPRSLRSRTRARNLTKVRGPRARGLWTRAMPDLVRLTTCPRLHSHTLAMPADRGRLRHAPRPRREHGLVAA